MIAPPTGPECNLVRRSPEAVYTGADGVWHSRWGGQEEGKVEGSGPTKAVAGGGCGSIYDENPSWPRMGKLPDEPAYDLEYNPIGEGGREG
jgi:hypothetical protein